MRSLKAREPVARGRDGRGRSSARTSATRGKRRSSGGYLRDRYGSASRLLRIVAIVFRRPMLALTLFLVCAGAVTGIVSGGQLSRLGEGMQSTIANAGFAVGDVTVAGAERTTGAEVYEALGIVRGESIFTVDAAKARARLLDLPWVADAEVRRTLPDAVAVRLIEKRPFALWRDGKAIVAIERSGAVISEVDVDGFASLPIFSGGAAPEAAAPFVDALRPYRAVAARLQMIQRMGERRWDLLLAGGVTVKLPEEGWQSQLAELEALIVEKAILERDVEMIDLRYPDQYVFRLHNGDSRPVSRERRA